MRRDKHWSNNPANWAPCDRELSHAEQMYLFALDKPVPEPVELLGPAKRLITRPKRKAWFEVEVG
jgi:hypothetical protein